jgi:hypothetical protein
MVSTPSVGISSSPQGPLVNAADMRPGTGSAETTGRLAVRNQHSTSSDVRIQAQASDHHLDSILRVELTAAGRSVFTGTLGQLRNATTGSFRLAPHQRSDLHIRAWLPTSASAGYQRRIENINLQLVASKVGA